MAGQHDINDLEELGGGSAGDWGELYKSLDRGGRMQTETPAGFVQSAPLSNDEMLLVARWCGLGRVQYDAHHNNRFGKLLGMRKELALVLDRLGHGDVMETGEDPELGWSEDSIMTPIFLAGDVMETLELDASPPEPGDGEPLRADPMAKKAMHLIYAIMDMQEGIERDQDEGHFQDYTRVKEMFASSEIDDVYRSGAKLEGLPFFYKEAIDFCETKRQGSRMTHVQALGARMIAQMDMERQARQRGTQKGKWRNAHRPEMADE